MTMWTRFMDRHSGGRTKEQNWDKIYIELPKAQAELYFYHRFGHSPYRVSCTCCGDDYSVYEYPTLEEACEYDRKNFRSKPIRFEEWIKHPEVRVINAEEIGDVTKLRLPTRLPRQGHVWVDEDAEYDD